MCPAVPHSLRSMNGLSLRRLSRCIAWAINSLPTPESPVISTDVSGGHAVYQPQGLFHLGRLGNDIR